MVLSVCSDKRCSPLGNDSVGDRFFDSVDKCLELIREMIPSVVDAEVRERDVRGV
jgi:hypothetical protein